MLGSGNCSPEMAVPMTVKMPEPITAPMPSAVSDHGPRVFLSRCSGSCESRINLSMDLRATSCLNRAILLISLAAGAPRIAGACRKGEFPDSGCLRRSVQGEGFLMELFNLPFGSRKGRQGRKAVGRGK